MNIRFDGQNHQIDANTLINVLIYYNSVINVANDMIGGGNRKVNVKINALEKGSFIVNIELVASVVKTLFSPDSLSYLADLVGVVGGAYALYATFKGKPVKKRKCQNKHRKREYRDKRHDHQCV